MESSTLTKVTRNGQVTLPAAVRRALRMEEGDYVEVRVVEDSVVLTPKKLVDKSQAYFWSPEWQAAEREASGDIGAGRIHEAATVEELLAELEVSRKKTP
jgi:AbrB family looped-hinge helix DNA binding protein